MPFHINNKSKMIHLIGILSVIIALATKFYLSLPANRCAQWRPLVKIISFYAQSLHGFVSFYFPSNALDTYSCAAVLFHFISCFGA